MAHLSRNLGLICSDARLADFTLAVALCLLYWLAMVVVRWNRVAMPNRFALRAQIASVRAELKTLEQAAAASPPTNAAGLLDQASRLIDGPSEVSGNRLLNYLFWSRWQEVAGWGYTQAAQIQMVPLLQEPTVRVRLMATAAEFELADDPACRVLADIAITELAAQPPALPRLHALLAQALSAKCDSDYGSYADQVSWQNKASWLVGCCLLLIVFLTSAFPSQSILFLVGATGGLLSRLSRSLKSKDAPMAYGTYWTTLFLSPVTGALGGWVGILIAGLAVHLQILDSTLGVGWGHAHEPMTLAVAVAFGTSERLLDSVFDKLDDKASLQAAPSISQAARSTAGAKAPFAIVDPGVIPGNAGQGGTVQLQITGAVGSVTWTLVQPAPAKLSITPAGGLLTWGPLDAGSFGVSVQAADSATHATAIRQVMIQIAAVPG